MNGVVRAVQVSGEHVRAFIQQPDVHGYRVEFEAQADMVLVDAFPDPESWWDGATFQAKTQLVPTITLSPNMAIITGLPDDAVVRVDHEVDTPLAGEIEIEFDTPGEYLLRITQMARYLDFTQTLDIS